MYMSRSISRDRRHTHTTLWTRGICVWAIVSPIDTLFTKRGITCILTSRYDLSTSRDALLSLPTRPAPDAHRSDEVSRAASQLGQHSCGSCTRVCSRTPTVPAMTMLRHQSSLWLHSTLNNHPTLVAPSLQAPVPFQPRMPQPPRLIASSSGVTSARSCRSTSSTKSAHAISALPPPNRSSSPTP